MFLQLSFLRQRVMIALFDSLPSRTHTSPGNKVYLPYDRFSLIIICIVFQWLRFSIAEGNQKRLLSDKESVKEFLPHLTIIPFSVAQDR